MTQSKWLSRKFLLAVIGGVVLIANAILEQNGKPPIDTDTVTKFVLLLASYILGEAWVDTRRD